MSPLKAKRMGAIAGIFILTLGAVLLLEDLFSESWPVYLPLFTGTLWMIRLTYRWGFK